jgi:hypothetical protein
MLDAPAAREFAPRRAAPWLALALILCSAAAVRVRLLDVPLERDEGGYAYFGEQMLEGVPPFASGYTMHLPGTTTAYAVAMAAFGRTARGARLGLLVANALAILFVFLLSRLASGSLGAVAAAATYAVLSVSPEVLGPFGHANHFVTLFGVAGLWALGRAQVSGRLAWFAGAGLLLGLAPVMKQSGAVFPAFAVCWLAWSRWRAGPEARRTSARQAAVLVGASMAGLALTLGLLALSGVLPKAWYWVFTYAGAYSGMETAADGLRNLGSRLSRLLPVSIGFVLLSLVGLALPEPAGEAQRPLAGRAFPAALLAATFAAACPGWYFRHHYFIPMLPAVALLCGRAVAALASGGTARRVAAAAAVTAACVQSLAAQRDVLFRLSPVDVARQVYGANPFPESVEVARYLAAHTGASDRIAILGSEPQILFYAHRRSATGYLYLYPLVEPNPLGPAMKDELIREVVAAQPRYVVWVDVPSSWTFRVAAAEPLVRWAGNFLESSYVLDGRVAILGPRRTEYAWGEEAARLGADRANILVFRRVAP